MMDAPTDQADRRRRIVGKHGVVWTIFEHVPGYDRRAQPTLIFMTTETIRRVRDFPPNWYELGDADLLALAEHR